MLVPCIKLSFSYSRKNARRRRQQGDAFQILVEKDINYVQYVLFFSKRIVYSNYNKQV